ncbi:MAG: hypothetical protein QM811_31915 [Pirellulales bacterium]
MKISRRTLQKRLVLASALLLTSTSGAWAQSAGSSPLVNYFPRISVATTLGTFVNPPFQGFDYNQATNTFYMINSGTSGGSFVVDSAESGYSVNYYNPAGYWQLSSTSSASYTQQITLDATALQLYAASASLAGNGDPSGPSTVSTNPTFGNALLNPGPLTIGGRTYAPGTALVFLDAALTYIGNTSTGELFNREKNVYVYDMRTIGSAAAPGSRDNNANGTVDWNDVFDTVFTTQDVRNFTGKNGNTFNVARNFSFSPTNSNYIYLSDTQTDFGGVWRVDLTKTGSDALHRVMNVTSSTGTRIGNEIFAISTSQRDLDPFDSATGDQLLVFGSEANGAGISGGVGFVTHSINASNPAASTTSTPRYLIQGGRISAFTGLATDTGNSAAVMKNDGTLYFTDTTSAVLKLDSQGRVSKLVATEQRRTYQSNFGTNTNTTYADLKLQQITPAGFAQPIDELLFTEFGSGAPVGILAFDPVDLNRDGVVNGADTALFKQEFNRPVSTTSKLLRSDTSTYQGYLNADLNGSAASPEPERRRAWMFARSTTAIWRRCFSSSTKSPATSI